MAGRKHKHDWRSPNSERNSELAKRKTVENRDPELAAEVVSQDPEQLDRMVRFMRVAQECGMPKHMAQALRKRMQTRYMPANEELKQVSTQRLLDLLDDRAHKALEFMDDVVFAEAPLRDLAMAASILIEKRQLLRGEPTAILSIEERENLNDLIPLIVQEAQRRGMTIDNNPMLAHDDPDTVSTILSGETRRGEIDGTHKRLFGFPESID